jgi:hypothetical protein
MEPSVTDLETTALEALTRHHAVGYEPVWGQYCPICQASDPASAVRELARRASYTDVEKQEWRERIAELEAGAVAAEADRDRLQAENADLINRLEISGELRKRAEAALDRLEWVDCDDLGRGHHVWTQSLPKPEDKCRCRSLTWAQANRAATDTPAPTDRDAA